MCLYESNKRLAIIRRILNTVHSTSSFFISQNAIWCHFSLSNRDQGKKTSRIEETVTFWFIQTLRRLSLCPHIQTSSIFRCVKRVKNAWNQESKVKPKNVSQKNNEPIRERCNNWTDLLALIGQQTRLKQIKPVTVLFKLTLSVTSLNLNYPF